MEIMMKLSKYIFIPFILVLPLISSAQKDDMYTKEWSDSNKLKISDFRGYPTPYRNEIIYPCHSIGYYIVSPGPPIWTYEIVAELDKGCSWIKPKDTAEAIAQLQYTQDMFDLVEVYARRIRKAYQLRTFFSSETFDSIHDEYERKMYNAFVSLEQQEHDIGIKVFIDLEQNIKEQLDSLKAYKNPIFKIEH